MEILGVLFMIFVGSVLAVGVMVAIGVSQRSAEVNPTSTNSPDRSRIAASILFHLLLAGGSPPDEALRGLRRVGIASPVTAGIDVITWGERFGQLATREQREWLLETAVQLIAAPARAVPLRQYAALLDLSFALGFQTDALAKLRQQYGFDYIDHAKDGRPREADRGGGSMPLFERGTTDRAALLRVLGLEGSADRQAIVIAYRRLAAQHHPDRFFGAPAEVQAEAAAKFIEITRAYEALMAIYRD